jgi:class 3 adenylate cyclase/tetratricopeptide (TPR) repeat protein
MMLTCAACSAANDESAKFCSQCGQPLIRNCSGCSKALPSNAKFCPECGAPVQTAPKNAPVDSNERRQVTVLFSDLADSTALSEQLDPEDLHELIAAYHSAGAAAVEANGGKVAKYLGDGLLVFFGYPTAREDDSECAVRAGLAIIREVALRTKEISERLGVKVGVRVGIHTGMVVAGEMGSEGSKSADVIGETPNLAARLQGIAEIGTVVISGTTQRLVVRSFLCEPLKETILRGTTRPMQVFRVVEEMITTEPQNDVPMIGRESERNILETAWRTVRLGEPHVAMLCGEAGIGKSRLLRWLSELTRKDGARLIEVHCAAHLERSPLRAVVETMRAFLGREAANDPSGEPIRDLLKLTDLETEQNCALLGRLLEIPMPEERVLVGISAESIRLRTLDLLASMIYRVASGTKTLLIVENAHWADPSSLQLIQRILEFDAGISLLTVVTYRPSNPPALNPLAAQFDISLRRLDASGTRRLASTIGGGKQLPEAVLAQIVARTDGVPLFVEELTRQILESGILAERGDAYELVGAMAEKSVPTSLRASLMARLDRLGTAKEVAQMCAVIGREFTLPTLAKALEVDESELVADLDRLTRAELVQRLPHTNPEGFRFRHALIRDAAYESLVRAKRQNYHRILAGVIEELDPQLRREQPEVLAEHYAAGGQAEAALACWIEAGQKLLKRSANVEAAAILERARGLVDQFPESPETLGAKLAVYAMLGTAHASFRGYASPQVGEIFSVASDLCDKLGPRPELAGVLYGLQHYFLARGEFGRTGFLANELHQLANATSNNALLGSSHQALGAQIGLSKDLDHGLQHVESACQLLGDGCHVGLEEFFGQNPYVTALGYKGYFEWNAGFPEKSIRTIDQCIQVARDLQHPFSIGVALSFRAQAAKNRRLPEEAWEAATIARQFAIEQSMPFYASANMLALGWVRVLRGEKEAGLEFMREGIYGFAATGSILLQPIFWGWVAETELLVGLLEEAKASLETGFEIARGSGETLAGIDLLRIQGDLLLRTDPDKPELAIESYQTALELAEGIRANSLALRSATSYAKLLSDLGSREMAASILAPVYSRFTEGFELPDLMEAKAVLEKVKQSSRATAL